MNQSRLRVVGTLDQSGRGPIITAEDGTVWVLEYEDAIDPLLGQIVAVDGTVVGFDRLEADWVGLAAEQAD
ncbi:MAG: DUF5818 domain-containing protein [Novosphingobium sp.]